MAELIFSQLLLTCVKVCSRLVNLKRRRGPPGAGSLPPVAVTHGGVADVLWLVGVLGACGAHVQHTHGSPGSGRTPSLKPARSVVVPPPPPRLLLTVGSPIPKRSPQRDGRKRTPLLFTAHGCLFPTLISLNVGWFFLVHFYIPFWLLLEFPQGLGQAGRGC